MKTIMFVGEGRAGKDTACEYFATITNLRNAGTTSKYLCMYMAELLGLPVEEAYARRHESDEMRTLWYDEGNRIRDGDPTKLVRQALACGEITGGIRALEEITAVREQKVVDLIVWVENNRVKKDPTVKFTKEDADMVIQNNGTIEEFHSKLRKLAGFAGLLKG